MRATRTLDRSQLSSVSTSQLLSPHFESATVRLYQQDALRLLPALATEGFSAVITDPPYCSGGATPAERTRDPREKYCHNGNDCGRPSFGGDSRDQRSYAWWCTAWLTLAREACAPSAYCLVFSDWRQLPTVTDAVQAAGWTWRGVISWDKGRGARAPHKGFFRHQCEYITWATNGPVPKANHAGPFDGCYHQSVRKSDKFHMTGKPTALMEQLVQIVPPGGRVLDPFSGSGTTGVACLRQGREFVGIEQSPEYCEIASSRLRDELSCESRP